MKNQSSFFRTLTKAKFLFRILAILSSFTLIVAFLPLIESQPFDGSFFGAKSLLYHMHNVLFGLFIIACGRRWETLCCGLILAGETGIFLTAMVANSDSYIDSYAIINTGMMLILGACVMSFFVNPVSIVASTTIWQLMFMVGWLTFTVPAVLQDYVDEAKSPGEFDPFLPADIKKKVELIMISISPMIYFLIKYLINL